MNYYEHHLGDYLRDTAHLSMVEDGAYRRLLDAYYIKELPLPKAVRDIYRLVRAGSKVEKDAVSIVLSEFFTEDDTGWRHKRCDTEIARYQDKQAKAKRSAEARWGAPKAHSDGNANASPDVDANGMRTHSDGNAHQSPDSSHQTPKKTEVSADLLPESEQPPSDFSIPLNDSTEYRVLLKDLDEWVIAFPAVDVAQELRQMRAWVSANPTKRKTRRGAPAFIVRWLSKAQDNPKAARQFTAPAGQEPYV